MKEIRLIRKGQIKIVSIDDEDYEIVNLFNWVIHFDGWNCYAVTSIRLDSKDIAIRMHRLIMNAPPDKQVDHKNHDTLDNRKANLRICDGTENQCNRKNADKTSTSKYLGVDWHKTSKKWQARLQFKNKPYYLGCFISEKQAAIVRDKVAVQLHGEFASLNFPELMYWGVI